MRSQNRKLTFHSVSGNKYICNQHKELGPLNKQDMLNLMYNILNSNQIQLAKIGRTEPPKKAKKTNHASRYQSKHR